MNWLARIAHSLRTWVHLETAERDLNDEIRFHLENQMEANRASGMNLEAARLAALRSFGGIDLMKEQCRDVRAVPFLASLVQDLRFALRQLRKSPGFTAVAVLTLALGIGANTAIFSLVNSVILQPLGYPKPEQLMFLTTQFGGGSAQFWVSPPEYMEFRELNKSFSAVGAYNTGEVNLNAADRPLRVRSAFVDDYLLSALGVQAAQGRLFARGETEVHTAPGEPTTRPGFAILSHELWQSAFGGGPSVGQMVEVNGQRVEVLGVMPPGFDVMDNRTQIWLPLGLNPANREIRGNHSLYLIGRLKDGVAEQAAQAELNSLIENWGERIGLTPGRGAAGHVFSPLRPGGGHILQMKPMQEEIVGSASRSIWVLQAAVGLVLLIACVNLANLLLARAETRRRELAVRTALGATRGRLLQQFIIEGLLLSAAGAGLGLLVARLGLSALLASVETSLPRSREVTIDPVVLLFTVGLSVATGLLFGLAPILHAGATRLASALKGEGARTAAGGSRHHIRTALVTAEVALAAMLVIGAGLLARTFYNLVTVDAGFDRSRLVTFSMTLPTVNYREPSVRAQVYQRLLGQLRALPGVQAATAMSGLPPNRPPNAQDTDIDNYTLLPDGPGENVDYYQAVMSDYFETMGIPIIAGRSFQTSDAASSGMVAVVNETLVNTFWRGRNPIGQRLRPCCFPGAAGASDDVPWFTVIGVAKDVKQGGVDQNTGTEFYQFIDQRANVPPPFGSAPATMNLVLRTTLPLTTLSQTIEKVVRDVDRTVPIVRLRDMEGVFLESIQRPVLLAQLSGAFAGLALLLAAIGIYGVLSYMVTARRREIGIRLALGADRFRVQLQVIKQGLLLTTIGLSIGLAAALGVNRFIQSLLFGVQPTDPVTLAIVAVSIVFVAAIASWLPARRAARVDPMIALRSD
jgi:predicted permease